MEKIYLVQGKNVYNGERNLNWDNLYAVKTKKQAKEDCLRLREQEKRERLERTYKYKRYYTYEEIDLY